MSIAELEARLNRLEKKVNRFVDQAGTSPSAEAVNGWIDQVHGTFQDDAAYRRAARLGRQWRESARNRRPPPSRAAR